MSEEYGWDKTIMPRNVHAYKFYKRRSINRITRNIRRAIRNDDYTLPLLNLDLRFLARQDIYLDLPDHIYVALVLDGYDISYYTEE